MQELHRRGADDVPWLSVIVTTHDRPDGVVRAVESILAHSDECALEVIVVDDGSDPVNAAALDQLVGPRVQVVHQPDLGLSAARATGVAHSSGRWVSFLDDDDVWLPSWTGSLLPLMEPPDVGVVSAAARFTAPDGRALSDEVPRPLGPLFGGITAQYLAGCFAVRRDVYDDAGGYLPGLSSSHQTELFIRLAARLAAAGLLAASVEDVVTSIERRAAGERSFADPRLLYDGTRWILARHALGFERDRLERSNWEAVVAVAAARLRESGASRRWSFRSLRSWPTRRSGWVRSGLAVVPAVGRRYWGVAAPGGSRSPSHVSPLVHAASLLDSGDVSASHGAARWFLPWGYEERPVVLSGTTEATDRDGFLDAGVLEAAEDPREVLRRFRDRLQPGRSGVVRAWVRASGPTHRRLGPPVSADRLREWTPDELELLLESSGLRAVRRGGWRPRGTVARIVRRSPQVPTADAGGRTVTFLVRPTTDER